MTEREVVEQIQPTLAELEAIGQRLMLLGASLPEVLVEAAAEDLEQMDYTTELRSVLRCVVADSVRPAIEDLKSVCALAPNSEGPAE